MDSEELLAQLADIHLPAQVSLWPPAPGWWILALLLLGAGYVLARRYLAYWRQQQVCRHALEELARCYQDFAHGEQVNLDAGKLRYVNSFNSVLRRVALVHFPQTNVASLGGRAWVDFIREKGDSSHLDDEIAEALSYGRFQTRCEVDVDALNSLGQAWISSLYLGKREANDQQQGIGG